MVDDYGVHPSGSRVDPGQQGVELFGLGAGILEQGFGQVEEKHRDFEGPTAVVVEPTLHVVEERSLSGK